MRLPPGGRGRQNIAYDLKENLETKKAMLPFSIPTAVVTDHEMGAPEQTQGRPPVSIDPSDVLLCDLGNKAMLAEDLENALRLWNKPAVLIAGRNSLDRLPVNLPGTILFLDLSWNRQVRIGVV